MLLPILVIKSTVWVSCNIHTNQKKEGVNQEYQVSQSTYQALLKFERLLLRVCFSSHQSAFQADLTFSYGTSCYGRNYNAEWCWEPLPSHNLPLPTSLREPLHPTCAATLLQDFARAWQRGGSQHSCGWSRETKHRALPHFRQGIKNRVLTSTTVGGTHNNHAFTYMECIILPRYWCIASLIHLGQ